MSKEVTRPRPMSLTDQEDADLKAISRVVLGDANKSGMIRMWINQNKHLIK